MRWNKENHTSRLGWPDSSRRPHPSLFTWPTQPAVVLLSVQQASRAKIIYNIYTANWKKRSRAICVISQTFQEVSKILEGTRLPIYPDLGPEVKTKSFCSQTALLTRTGAEMYSDQLFPGHSAHWEPFCSEIWWCSPPGWAHSGLWGDRTSPA